MPTNHDRAFELGATARIELNVVTTSISGMPVTRATNLYFDPIIDIYVDPDGQMFVVEDGARVNGKHHIELTFRKD